VPKFSSAVVPVAEPFIFSGADSGAAADAGSASAAEGSKAGWLAQKEEAARQRKKENAIRKVEEEIAALEARSKEIDEEFLLPGTGTDLPKCQALSREQEGINKKLEELYEKWEELSE
jgi:ATP-binding cassette subfamily F protein 3